MENLFARKSRAFYLCRGLRRTDVSQETSARARVVKLVEEVIERAAADADAQVVGRHIFQRMGLVKDNYLVIGQQARSLAPQNKVAEEQGVVNDKDVGAVHLLARPEVEALRVVGAGAAQAV